MDKPRVLIIEDEEKIARVLELELSYEGYDVGIARDGLEGYDLFHKKTWNVVLLDIMLPGMSGIELLRRIRTSDSIVSVIMLTAKDSVEDKVSGLDLGANDYITKPFQMEELLARVRVSLRNHYSKNEGESKSLNWVTFSDLRLCEATHEVVRSEKTIDLTPREFDLLAYLMKHPRQVLNREQLLNGVWGYDYYGDTNVVDVYIRYLRNKLDKPFSTPLIQTVRGIGYTLKEAK